MNVQELINDLMKIEDKSLPVFGYNGEPMSVDFVDNTIRDRVDLNLITDYDYNDDESQSWADMAEIESCPECGCPHARDIQKMVAEEIYRHMNWWQKLFWKIN